MVKHKHIKVNTHRRKNVNQFDLGGDTMLPGAIGIYETLKTLGRAAKRRIYRTVTPLNYNIKKAAKEFISGKTRNMNAVTPAGNEEWARYLGVPYSGTTNFEPAIYKPAMGKTYPTVLKFKDESLILSNDVLKQLIEHKKKTGKNTMVIPGNGAGLGSYTVSLGVDENGKPYASYYDDWDINPFKGINAAANIPIISGIEDIVPTSNPFTVYGRRYYTDDDLKANGGPIVRMFEDGGDTDPLEYTHQRFPVTKEFDIHLYNDPHFTPEGMGNIEYMNAEHDTLPYYNNYQKPNDLKGKSVVVYNDKIGDATNEAIALDILSHGLREQDPIWKLKYLPALTDAFEADAIYNMTDEDKKIYNLNDPENRKEFVDNYIDGYIRTMAVDDKYRDAMNYLSRNEFNKIYNTLPSEQQNALTEAYSYIHPTALPEVTVIGKRNNKKAFGGDISRNETTKYGEILDLIKDTLKAIKNASDSEENALKNNSLLDKENINWDNLSMHDKAAYIRMGVANGYKNIEDIKNVYNEFRNGGYLYGNGGNKAKKSNWVSLHQQQWYSFLRSKGVLDADAQRLSGFFAAQDAFESGSGSSNAARTKNNYGGMLKGGKNISYASTRDYMEDKWRMMNSRFKNALSAKSIDEYATILGNPSTAGKGYLYYVTDKVKYDPKSPLWKAALTLLMHTYINGMRSLAGKSKVNFKSIDIPVNIAQTTKTNNYSDKPLIALNDRPTQKYIEYSEPVYPENSTFLLYEEPDINTLLALREINNPIEDQNKEFVLEDKSLYLPTKQKDIFLDLIPVPTIQRIEQPTIATATDLLNSRNTLLSQELENNIYNTAGYLDNLYSKYYNEKSANIFDGTTEPTQQMNNHEYFKPIDNLFVDAEGNVLDPNVPSAKGTVRLPDVVATRRDPRKPVPTAFDKNEDLLRPMMDFVPGVGDALQAKDAIEDARNGDYINAGVGASLLLLPNIIEKPLKYLGKGLKHIKNSIELKKLERQLSNITDKEWDDAYFAAINAGDMETVQQLRDLHFYVKSGHKPKVLYRGSKSKRNTYFRDDGSAVWFTPDYDAADFYRRMANTPESSVRSVYIKPGDKPLSVDGELSDWDMLDRDMVPEDVRLFIPENADNITTSDVVHYAKEAGYDQVDFKNVLDATSGSNINYPQTAIRKTNNIKLSDAITYDDAGNIIPLSKRDNFNNRDLRYGWVLPAIGLGGAGTAYGVYDDSSTNVKALGGPIVESAAHYYDGTTEDSQKMDNSYTYYKPLENIFVDSEGNLLDPNVPSARGSIRTPDVVVTANPLDVGRGKATRLYNDYGIASNDATSTPLTRNVHLNERGIEGAAKAAAWMKDNPTLNNVGMALGAVPFAVAGYPAFMAAGEGAATALANPYVDAALTSGFGAHGLQSLANGEADWTTALEIAPLGRVVKPLYNAIKPSVNFVPTLDNNLAGIRYAYSRNPELANIGTLEEYNDYIKTIFPESKVRDINYHMGPKGLQELRPSTGDFFNTNPEARGIYVTPDKSYAQSLRRYTTDRLEKPSIWTYLKRQLTPGGWDKANEAFTDIYPVMIDTKNPLHTKGSWTWGIGDKKYQSLMDDYDAIVNSGPKWYQNFNSMPETIVPKTEQSLILGSDADVTGFRRFMSNPQITAENAASMTPKVNWDADNWFKTISGRGSYSSEEAAELASHVPEYREIERRLFDEGKLIIDSEGNISVKGSEMSPQEYIMRQSEAFQKMNPEHHYVGVNKGLRNSFENESRDPATKNRYEVWTDRKSPKNVEEYAQSMQGGYTNDSQIETIERQMAVREESYTLHKEQLKWKLDHGKISQEIYDRDLADLEDMYNWKQKVAEDELKALKQQKALDPLNGGKVFDVTYPIDAVETPIIDAGNNHWARIPFDNVVRDAPDVISHYTQRPYSNELQTDQIISAARRNGYGVTHIDNVMDTYDGTMLNETIIGRNTPVKSVLGNTGTFDVEGPNKWKLYRSLIPPFLGLGAIGTLYGKQL